MLHILPQQATACFTPVVRLVLLLTLLLLISLFPPVQAQTSSSGHMGNKPTIAGLSIPTNRASALSKNNKTNRKENQKRANEHHTEQTRIAQTKAVGDQFCLSTDLPGDVPTTFDDAGIINGGQSLTTAIDLGSGVFATYRLEREAVNGTWEISLEVLGISAVVASNTATSTTIPFSDWEDLGVPGTVYSISLATGACPVLVPKQVCVTLCDGTLLTLIEDCSCNGYPNFYSAGDLYNMYFDGTEWVMDFDFGTLFWTSGGTGPLPPASGWTETVNGACAISVNPNQACAKLPAGSVCVTLPDGTKLDLASEPEDYNGALDYYTADGAYSVYRRESTSVWRFVDYANWTIDEENPSTALTVPTTGWPTVSITKGTCIAPICTFGNVLLLGNGTLSCQTPTLSLSAVGGTSYSFSGPGIVSQFGGIDQVAFMGYLIRQRAIPTIGTTVVNKPGTYTVVATDERGCTATISLIVTGQECR